ncbi:MAG: adenylate/guanylate cyclase domain-containing protein, partial [Chloroflexota bacterium]|nr:adenylate/guanylate cyclase domain-containing protein [Chloroflexota bacterium]
MSSLPTGSVTLLFTDIEGSTRLLQQSADRYSEMLAEHRRAIRTAVAAHRGVEVDTQGDAFLMAFSQARDAAAAAVDAQRSLAGGPIRVRMGIHTGQPALGDNGYIGIDVHRGARICAAGHGGQVLLSDATRRCIEGEIELRDLGEHRLKDMDRPEWLFQLCADGLVTEFPPLRSLNNSNLPSWPSSFVGRERELSELGALLSRDETRLITLTGPGGTGKTRLAIAAAATVVGRFKNGVFLVELASISDPERVFTTIAQTLGARSAANESPLQTLRRHLDGKSTLLALDNFEQVLPAADGVARLLESTPGLRVLVTSRERLRIQGEHEFAVPPMNAGEAYDLFVQRATAILPDFDAAIDRVSVQAICTRLDGLPLAIELAAARVKMLSASDMLKRLEHRLATLTQGPRDLPQRQQTLRSTIDWSFGLLDTTEQQAFARLSVFVGGCPQSAAEAVCDVSFDVLASLVDKSLLRLVPSDHGERRFAMLETIREYGGEVLRSSGGSDRTRGRHAAYFAKFARAAQTGDPARGALHDESTGAMNINAFYGRADEATLLDLLSLERDNLVSALE